MDFRDTPSEAALREQVRQWLRENLPAGWGTTVFEPAHEAERFAFRLDWEKRLHRGGWSGIAWPKEYGGRDASPVEQAIFLEEMARADAPDSVNIIGRNLTGPTLMAHGSPAQKERFLPAILNGEEVWCQGFSEPNSGSDLASVRTRATLDRDAYVVNGQKIWTSFAQYAQWCILLARTDAAAVKHRGLSFLLVDMRTPGITIRPLVQITGESEFSEVFFDDVRVPAENLVGELNQGWKIAMTTLQFERGPEEALPRQVRFHRDLAQLFRVAAATTRGGKPVSADPVVRQKLAASFIELEVMRLTGLRGLSRLAKGQELGQESSFAKLYWSHMYQRLLETAIEVAGADSALAPGDADAPANGFYSHRFLQSRAMTIYSGTSEIQRNIIAERVLGMPR
jgi:alkylation response protein AidB-like acyl-CoA dehydrogenase